MLVILFVMFYSISLGPVPWILVGEILPAKGVSMSVTAEWISSSIVAIGYLHVANAIGRHNTFYIFSCINLAVNQFYRAAE